MASDNGVGVEGWYVDNIVRANGCGGILRSGIYNAANVRQDTAAVPVFVTPNPLPLTLLSFYAHALGSQVALDWKTTSEINVKGFSIEWSTDGIIWSSIGSTTAQNRNSNSYGFVHTNPATGTNYYRIRMNDADGQYTYSPVRTINLRTKGSPLVVLVPNPVHTEAVLYISKEAKARSIKVVDAAGSIVRQMTVGTGTQQIKIATTGLAAGVYTIETTGESRYITRMVVQH
jgi:extracellular elastinolytic metalloproteinase